MKCFDALVCRNLARTSWTPFLSKTKRQPIFASQWDQFCSSAVLQAAEECRTMELGTRCRGKRYEQVREQQEICVLCQLMLIVKAGLVHMMDLQTQHAAWLHGQPIGGKRDDNAHLTLLILMGC